MIKIIKNKLFKKLADRENCMDFLKELYEHEIFYEIIIKDIRDECVIVKDNSNKKQRDDLEQ